ncbi:hypothetical protein OIU84_020934 [Salix udensis]|uniref:Uncharacterized protein n=1 Tax=Salix udensis TaxID=889485 RepID=A0AAD6KUY2_9ROSI|nr:hypothetical protein OIU84_020934 [Salix udensis]
MLYGPDVVYKSHWYEMIICRIFIQIPSRQAFRTVICLIRAGFCSVHKRGSYNKVASQKASACLLSAFGSL